MPSSYSTTKSVSFWYGVGSNSYYSSINTFGLKLESEIIGFPEASGMLDVSSAFYGKPYEITPVEYKRRRLVFNFGLTGVTWQWPFYIRDLTEKIHGKKYRITTSSIPGYYFIGRCYVASYERALRIGKVQVIVDAEPYMVKNTETTITNTTSKAITFTNDSKFDTPASIVIAPSSTSGTMTIYCTSSGATLWQVNLDIDGSVISLDGINKKILQDGAAVEADVQKAFPYFKPGSNKLYIRPNSMSVSSTVITYNERSM